LASWRPFSAFAVTIAAVYRDYRIKKFTKVTHNPACNIVYDLVIKNTKKVESGPIKIR